MQKTARNLAFIGLTTALLIAGQLALSGIQGVEIVTVLLLSFCYVFGVKCGLITATAYSLLRCIIFGFFPTVVILYLIYYNLFAVVIGLLGKPMQKLSPFAENIILAVVASVLTVCFTLIDDVITPLYFSYGKDAAKAYFFASLPAMITQTVCAFITVLLMFRPLSKIYSKFKR